MNHITSPTEGQPVADDGIKRMLGEALGTVKTMQYTLQDIADTCDKFLRAPSLSPATSMGMLKNVQEMAEKELARPVVAQPVEINATCGHPAKFQYDEGTTEFGENSCLQCALKRADTEMLRALGHHIYRTHDYTETCDACREGTVLWRKAQEARNAR